MELRRPRGFATFVTYPLKDASGNLVSGVVTLNPQYATFTDANPVSTITNIAGFCKELGATGIYYSSLSAAEMANDYIYFIASASSGSSKRMDLLINCTKIASVQAVSDTVTATLSSGTGTGQVNLTNGRPGINWTDIINATLTQGFTLTTIGTVSNVATTNFCASVSSAVLSNVGTVTGVTNSVAANVGTVTVVVNSVTANVATITGVTNSVTANVATITGVTNSVTANVATITGVTNSVNANVATVTGVTNSVSANVATVTGVVNSVSVTTITGVSNSVGVRAGTGPNVLNISNGRIGLNWTDIQNATSTQALTLTTFATASHVDDLTSTTYPEPAAVPAASATLKNKMGWLTLLGRNQITISSVTQVAWDDTGTATVSFATHSDAAGLFTKNEWQ